MTPIHPTDSKPGTAVPAGIREIQQKLLSRSSTPANSSEPRTGAGDDRSAAPLPGLFDEEFRCSRCGGSGFELGADNVCRLCACVPVRRTRDGLKRLGLFAAAKRMTFDAYRTDAPWQAHLCAQVRAFAGQASPGWLFIGGQSGCGKTHLCTAAAVTLLQRGFSLQYMRWMNESARLKTLALDGERQRILHQYIASPLLYVDDLFKSAPTDADKHIAFELLDARCSDPEKITLLSSERTLEEILAIDEAIGGRIMERCGRFVLNVHRDPARNFRRRMD